MRGSCKTRVCASNREKREALPARTHSPRPGSGWQRQGRPAASLPETAQGARRGQGGGSRVLGAEGHLARTFQERLAELRPPQARGGPAEAPLADAQSTLALSRLEAVAGWREARRGARSPPQLVPLGPCRARPERPRPSATGPRPRRARPSRLPPLPWQPPEPPGARAPAGALDSGGGGGCSSGSSRAHCDLTPEPARRPRPSPGPQPGPPARPPTGPCSRPAAGPHGAAGCSLQRRLRCGPRQLHLGERRARFGGTPARQVRTGGHPGSRALSPYASFPACSPSDGHRLARPVPKPRPTGSRRPPLLPGPSSGGHLAGVGQLPCPGRWHPSCSPRSPPMPSPRTSWACACRMDSLSALSGPGTEGSGTKGTGGCMTARGARWPPGRGTRRGDRSATIRRHRARGQGAPSFRRLPASSKNMKVWAV